ERLNVVDFFTIHKKSASELRKLVQQIGDLERLISKVAMSRVNPREMVQLKRGLQTLNPIVELLNKSENDILEKTAQKVVLLDQVVARINNDLEDEAGALISKGNFVKANVDKELDELRDIRSSGKNYIARIQQQEAERTGISSLKIGFNNVFGYYLEV